MASKPNATVIPSNAKYSAPSRVFCVMNLLSPGANCNISVSFNKSLRQISSARYNRAVDNRVQAPIAAPIFLPSARQTANERDHLFESDAPLNLSLSAGSALLKTALPQLAYSQSLPHSLKNNPGYGVEGLANAFPFWERPVAAIASQIAGLSVRTWQLRARQTRSPLHAGENRLRGREQPAYLLSRFSLAIKKQSIPNLPPITGNERKANTVYKVFRRAVLFLRRIDR
jgi:hypothetical protein